MATVGTLMGAGMPAEQAKALVLCKATTYDAEDLVGLGFQAHLAKYIADFGSAAPTVAGLMALGVPARLAVEVEALMNA